MTNNKLADECFCDRMYPDSNPNASCGDCPTRDYGAQPPSIPEPSELRKVAKRCLRSYIENGSDDKALMLKCLEELS